METESMPAHCAMMVEFDDDMQVCYSIGRREYLGEGLSTPTEGSNFSPVMHNLYKVSKDFVDAGPTKIAASLCLADYLISEWDKLPDLGTKLPIVGLLLEMVKNKEVHTDVPKESSDDAHKTIEPLVNKYDIVRETIAEVDGTLDEEVDLNTGEDVLSSRTYLRAFNKFAERVSDAIRTLLSTGVQYEKAIYGENNAIRLRHTSAIVHVNSVNALREFILPESSEHNDVADPMVRAVMEMAGREGKSNPIVAENWVEELKTVLDGWGLDVAVVPKK